MPSTRVPGQSKQKHGMYIEDRAQVAVVENIPLFSYESSMKSAKEGANAVLGMRLKSNQHYLLGAIVN